MPKNLVRFHLQKKAIVIGETNLCIECIKYLLNEHWLIIGVVSKDIVVVSWCDLNNIPFYSLDTIQQIKVEPCYVFSIINPYILTDALLHYLQSIQSFNYHDSLLPKYAGSNSTTWAIWNCEKEHGISFHEITKEIDAGDLYYQQKIIIEKEETALSLNIKCTEQALKGFLYLIKNIESNALKRVKQDLVTRTYYGREYISDNYGYVYSNFDNDSLNRLWRALNFGDGYRNPIASIKVFSQGKSYILTKKKTSEPIDINGYKNIEFKTIYGKKMKGVTLPQEVDHYVLSNEQLNIIKEIKRKELRNFIYFRDKLSFYSLETGCFRALNRLEKKCCETTLFITLEELSLFLLIILKHLCSDSIGIKVYKDISQEYPSNSLLHLVEVVSIIGATEDILSKSMQVLLDEVEKELEGLGRICIKDFYYRYQLDMTTELAIVSGKYIVVDEHRVLFKVQDNRLSIDFFEEDKDMVDVFVNTIGLFQRYKKENKFFLYTLRNIPLISDEEYQKWVVDYNKTERAYPKDKTIHQLFEEQVARTPNNIAVVFENRQITYQELNNKANQLADYLHHHYNTQADDIICLLLERSEWMIIAIIGVLKSGAAYCPISPEYPEERVLFILQDTQPKCLITNCKLKIEHVQFSIVNVTDEQFLKELYSLAINHLPLTIHSHALAYIIYTSGTTGHPKGVMVEHRNIVNYLFWMKVDNYFLGVNNIDASIEYFFDALAQVLFTPLVEGKKVVIASQDRKRDIVIYVNYLIDNKIELIKVTPSYLEWLVDELLNDEWKERICLRKIIVGGERTNFILRNRLSLLPYEIIHHYGPTEATIGCLSMLIDKNKLPDLFSLGKFTHNINGYILNNNLQLLPIGSMGELYIGGDGVARGYLNRPELTAERFIQNPFQTEEEKQQNRNDRLYKTGDLVRMLPDGNIEYIGRNDFQVKIRGYRIELGEIENRIQGFQDYRMIEQVVVLVNEKGDNKYLVGYFVANEQVDVEELRSYLSKQLPDYMVPTGLVQIEQMPLTVNGKLDRKTLLSCKYTLREEAIQLPKNITEERLLTICSALLEIDKSELSVTESFFRLGGNSILNIRLMNMINKEFNTSFSVRIIFEKNTIRQLADYLLSDNIEIIAIEKQVFNSEEEQILSYAQNRLWFIYQYGKVNSAVYNIPMVFELDKLVDKEKLKEALLFVLQKHEILRTIIEEKGNGIAYQVVKAIPENIIQEEMYIHKDDVEKKILNMMGYLFQLDKELPIRIKFFMPKNNHAKILLSIVIHHIAFDGWSIIVFQTEVYNAYQLLINEQPLTHTTTIQYKDYALWQRNFLQGTRWDKELNYWKQQLEEYNNSHLPADFSRPLQINYQGDGVVSFLSKRVTQKLKEVAKELDASLHSVLLSGYYLFLSAYSNDQDIVVGSPFANRHYTGTEEMIGFFVNSLGLRIRIDVKDTLKTYIEKVKEMVIQGQSNQDIPFEKLVEKLQVERDTSRNPIFQIMFSYQNFRNDNHKKLFNLCPQFNEYELSAKFDITTMVSERNDKLQIYFNYATALYKRETIERFIKTYEFILTQIGKDKLDNSLNSIRFIDDREYNYLVYDYNKTEKEYPKDKTIHQLFEEQVARTPNNIAVLFEDKKLTYQELNNKANQLAHYLHHNYDTKVDDIICLLLERSEWMIIAILGVLKSGAAYCPISPEYPNERVLFILQDTQPKCLITNCKLQIENVQFLIVNLMNEEFIKILYSFTINHLPLTISSHSLAYIIYTSGTTGNPKGVMVDHSNVVSLVKGVDYVKLDSHSFAIQLSDICFDAFTFELWGMLLNGGKIYVPKDIKNMLEVQIFKSYCVEHNINILWLTKTLFEALYLQDNTLFKHLTYLLVGGEALNPILVQQLMCANGPQFFINGYGPTENTTFSLTYTCNKNNKNQNISIGKPLNNRTAFVVSNDNTLLPIGSIGELYLGGDGLSRGYLNRPELTAERFIKNPFQTEEDKKKNRNGRLYKTGDIVRMLPDGNIEYIGRNDFQVKIRGYRIELGEIETRIQGFQDFRMIEEAVVLVNKKAENKYLVGYFVAKEQVDVEELRSYLSKQLPEYMVPTGLLQIEQMPLTVNGKLDRKALLAIEYNLADSKEYKAPTNELEQQLLSIWEKLLGNNSIGVQDDFFRVGGDSIKSIQLSSRVRSELGKELSVKDVFEHRTIERMVSHVLSNHQIKVYLSEQGKLSGELPLLPIQQYFFELKLTNEHHYNQSFLIETPELEIEKLKMAIEKIVEQHDAFRLSYRKDTDGNIIQYYDSKKEAIPLDVLDISEWNVQEGTVVFEEKLKKQYTSWQDGFNIYEGKTYQISYIWGYKNKIARIFIAAHHLIIDAVSWRILLEDIEIVYAGKKLLAKRTSYRQWVNIGKDYVAHYPNELSYWEGIENKVQENIIKLLSKITIQEEDYITTIAIDSNITNYLLLSANQVFYTEINDLLLTALARALGKLFDEQEVSILLEGHGRESLQDDIDISKTMGWFTSIVPIHLPIYDNVQESIIEVKEELRRIPNKGIGYGFIRGYKHLSKISFNYLGVFKKEEQQDWFLTNESSGMSVSNKNKSNLWLDINGGVGANGVLEFSIRGRLTKEYIDNLSIYFKQEMIVITNYIQSVNRSYLTPSDTHYILSKDLLNRLQIDNEIQAIYVANSLQAGFIYHYLSKSEGDDAYKVQLLWKYKSQVNEDYFIQSWQQALDRYPGLRVRFNWEEEIVQIIDKKITLDYRFRDIQDKRNKEKAIEGIRIVDRKEDYDLAKGNLLRVYLIQVDKEEFVVLYSNHHAISDGWSNPNLLNYIHEVYNSLINQNTPVELLEEQAYLRAQEYLQVKSKNNIQDKWWVDYLSGVERTIEVRGLRKQEANGINLLDYKFIQEPISKIIKIKDKEYRALSSFIKQEGLTWSNLIMWCWSKALSIHDNRHENIIGITLSGRGLPINDIEQSVGLYINTLPLVVRHDSNESILNILKNIQKDTEQLNQLTHTHLSGLHSNASDRLFATMVVYENYPIPTNKDNQEANTLMPIFLSSVEKTDYPLTVLAYEKDSVLSVEIKYAGELFEEKQIERLLKLMSLLLQQIPIGYNKLEQELILIDNEEYNYLVYDYNKTEKEYPKDKTIHQLFEEQVARTPNNIAVVFEDKKLTYQELNNIANQLAYYLYNNYQTKADDIICLLLERSEWMIIAILGVLKSGVAYCPISPEYPEERVLFILQDTQPKCLITNCKLKIENVRFTIVNVTDEQFLKKLYSLTINHLPFTISSRSLAYIIYTSGTTGNPKGVMVEHKNVVNLLYATAYILYPINQTYLRASAFTSYQFDVSVSEFLSPLVQGGELHIFNELAIQNISFLSQYIIEKSINYLYIPPVLLSQLPQHIYPELKHIIYAGEPCNRNIANDWSKNYLLFNYYGPTESTIYALGKQINIDEVEQIGKPIYNIKIYLLNTKLQVVPIGSIGELHIGGDGVARGYLNRPDLTAERFIKNPFQTEEEKKKNRNGRLYKTGDVVRMLPDGNIEYIGRNDFQVKIRGYRIELGEIEIRIQGFQTRIEGLKDEQVIEQVEVLVNEKGDNKYLVGYFVAKEQVDVEELRSYLSKQLPDYMVPTGLLQIEKMPLTINGKLDRKILLDMDANFVEDNIEAPTNNLELRMLQIFATLLSLEPNTISVNNSFFRLGGNSILSIRLASILNREFGTFLSVVDIFKYPTIRELALQANYKKTSFDLVLMLNNSIVKQAIYMIHPGGAGAEVYYNMAYRLQESYICYGIGNYNLFSDNKMSEISLLAKYYLHEIKNNTTIEPCILLGWSLGGKIALEMAYHLEQQGIKDIVIYLLDTIVMDETLINILDKEELILREQPLNELLGNLNVDEDYKQRVIANRSIEYKLHNDVLTGKLIYSRCVLFKAMLPDKNEVSDSFQYKLSLPYNNVDKFVSIENIKLIEMQVSHQDIIKKEDEIVDVIKQMLLLKDANKEL